MKGLVLSLTLLISVAAFAQSLTELAKKEKERRKTNAGAGKKAVVEAEGAGTPIEGQETDSIEGRSVPEDQASEPDQTAENTDKDAVTKELRTTVEQSEGSKDENKERQAKNQVETPKQRADRYAAQMYLILNRYPDVKRKCEGEPISGTVRDNYVEIGKLNGYTARDEVACSEAYKLRTEYSELRKKLWAAEGSNISQRELPKELPEPVIRAND